MINVVITGCAGQTGSYLCDAFAEESGKYNIIGVAKKECEINTPNLSKSKKYINCEVGDISSQEFNEYLVKTYRPALFINMAGLSSVAESFSRPEDYNEINYKAVERQLESIKKYSPKCRYLNAGSSEEIIPNEQNIKFHHRNPYGLSKIMARKAVYDARITGLLAQQPILFNHESARRAPHFLSNKCFCAAIQAKKDLNLGRQITPILVGNIHSQRDWSHAYDIANGLKDYITRETFCEGKDYVFNSGELHSVADLIDAAFFYCGFDTYWKYSRQLESWTLRCAKNNVTLVIQSVELKRREDEGFTCESNRYKWHKMFGFKEMIKDCLESYDR